MPLYPIWRSARTQIGVTLSTPPALVAGIVQPAAFIAVALLAAGHVGVQRGTQFVVGGMMLSLWSSTLWAAGSILRREKYSGTLAALVTRPTPLLAVIAGKTLGASVASGAMILLSGSAIVAAAGVPVAVGPPGYLAAMVVCSMLSSAALGIAISCMTLLTRAATRVIEALTYPVFVLGGLIVPTSELPRWLQWPGWLVSLHWAVVGISGRSTSVRVAALAAIGLLTLGYACAAVWTTQLVLDRARKRATLEFA